MKRQLWVWTFGMLLCVLLLTSLFSCGKSDGDTSEFLFEPFEEGYAVIAYKGNKTDVEIPAEHDGRSVIKIAHDAFYNHSSIKSIQIPNSVRSIDDHSFSNCTNLQFNEYGDAYYLGNEQNPYHVLVQIKNSSFSTYSIHEDTKLIYTSAFENCSFLTSISIPNGVIGIGSAAFANCSRLASISIPNGVTSIGNGVFANCKNMKVILIPDSVTSIGDDAFSGCSNLSFNEHENAYYLGNNQNPYHVLVKAKDSAITTCSIHKSTKLISSFAFANCPRLTSITFKGNVINIERSAFKNCAKLESITIPYSVKSIGDQAFLGCSSLKSVTFGKSSVLKSIGHSAFMNCSSLTSITIPESVMSIGDEAFSNCTSITNIALPSGFTSIGGRAFSGCQSLTNISLPSGITNINEGTFLGCTSLKSITIPKSTTFISLYAFYGCSSLEEIEIPSNVINILDGAFGHCTNLKSVTFSLSFNSSTLKYRSCLTSINCAAFSGCSNLTNIEIPSSVTKIGQNAFEGCSSLESITFADPSTWYRATSRDYKNATKTDVTNPYANATYFESTYSDYYWYKE